MEAHQHHTAVPCRCGGQAKIFGPSRFAPSSHWGIYCSKDNCEKMAVADTMEEAVDCWNEEQMLEIYSL
ncbi:MAG: hypothetical protein R6W66_05260 [Pelovirga sp.]